VSPGVTVDAATAGAVNPRLMRVRILPATVADQIAAGEVVERAASVVKELCENSLDAGATRVEVELEGGGRRLVKVIDDGSGMDREDALMALRRHATSKIESVDDLWGLHSFGFRGEALPSIAAIARMTLLTKRRDALGAAGLRIEIEGGTVLSEAEVGMPDGTQIEVRDLFFNTPARLKFQKTEATESGNVAEAVLRLALAHEQVHFRLRTAGRLTLDLPPHRSRAERVRAALARRGAGVLQEAAGSAHGVNVQAFLAAPEEAATSARSTFLFVGTRFVRDRALLHALSLGYGDLLEKGRYPLAVLFVDVPGQELDINVHPQKLEVRFARAQEVYAAVREVVASASAHAPWQRRRQAHSLPPSDWDEAPSWMGGRRLASDQTLAAQEDPLRVAGDDHADTNPPSYGAAGSARAMTAFADAAHRAWGQSSGQPSGQALGQPSGRLWGRSFAEIRDERETGREQEREPQLTQVDPDLRGSPAWREVGVAHGCGLVCVTAAGVLLVDGHVVLAEETARSLGVHSRPLPSRPLLFPMPVTIGANHVADQALLIELVELGFTVRSREDGAQSSPSQPGEPVEELWLTGLPAAVSEADPKPLLLDVVAALRGDEAIERQDHLARSRSALRVLACYATDDASARLPEVREALERNGIDAYRGCACWHGYPGVGALAWRGRDQE